MLVTLQPTMLVRRMVGHCFLKRFWRFLAIFGIFCIFAPAQMLELACFIIAPAYPHATTVAVYLASLFDESCKGHAENFQQSFTKYSFCNHTV